MNELGREGLLREIEWKFWHLRTPLVPQMLFWAAGTENKVFNNVFYFFWWFTINREKDKLHSLGHVAAMFRIYLVYETCMSKEM